MGGGYKLNQIAGFVARLLRRYLHCIQAPTDMMVTLQREHSISLRVPSRGLSLLLTRSHSRYLGALPASLRLSVFMGSR